MTTRLTAAILILAGTPAFAHRLDEYLQGTIVSIEKNRLQAEMTLTPGVAVSPRLIASIDTDSNGAISEVEQRAYARSVLRDLSLTVDGYHLTLQLLSIRFPALDEMQDGRGEIKLEFQADLPHGGRNRKLILENRHQSGIAAYQVNCTVPRDPDIYIATQTRNYSQSSYELEYVQANVSPESASVELSPVAVVMFISLAILWLRHVWPVKGIRRLAHWRRN
jgi:hypothetical protein